jgi:hypothetical protein
MKYQGKNTSDCSEAFETTDGSESSPLSEVASSIIIGGGTAQTITSINIAASSARSAGLIPPPKGIAGIQIWLMNWLNQQTKVPPN